MECWKSVGKQHLLGIANNNYQQDNKPHRLNLDVGDSLIIIRESAHWYYGYKKKNRALKGIFPKSYVHLFAAVEVEIIKNDLVVRRSEIANEITSILKEWHGHFKAFFLTSNPSLKKIREKMLELIKLRAQMLSGNLPVDEMKDIKLKATSEIDTGNKLLGLDMVVRDDNGNIVDINQTSTTQLYEHHVKATTRIQQATSGYNKNRLSKQMNKFSHNLLISVHNFVCKLNEDTELLFTLYDGEAMKPITENYLVRWNRQGIASSYFSNIRVLFTDLSSRDLERNKIYLVTYVVRIGGMDLKDNESRRVSVTHSVLSKRNSMQSQHSSSLNLNELMRRPFGVAALDLTPIIKKADDFKSDTQLSMPFIQCEKETLDQTLKKLINNKDMGKDGQGNIWISVELLHGDLKQLKEEYPHLIHGSISHARKMGFPEVIFPGDVRNDLYVTIVQAEFSKSVGKTTDRNIEVIVSVCSDEGQLVERVISQGGGSHMNSEYHSVIYYHEDKPKWNETFKVNFKEIDDFRKCHLKFMFKHRSSNETKDKNEKPFAVAFVKLQQENGTTLQQGQHNLVVYKLDYKKYDEKTAFNYYSLPSRTFELSTVSKPTTSGYTIAVKDTFIVDINLCSTKLTQDLNLLGLFKWSENPESLQTSLTQLLQVKPEEIVKFLQDILDALFDILVNNRDPLLYDDLVFQCLVLLIEIVNDKKYQHFQSVLELYINDSFSWTNAYEKLINVLERHFLDALNRVDREPKGFISETATGDKLYKTTKNMQYIMKFIIQSRILYAKMFEDKNKFAFETRLEELLGLFVTLIALKEPLLKSQGAILKYLHVITSDLMEIYDPLKLSNFIVEIITKIPNGRLTQWKMICIKDIVDSKIFRLPLCRGILLPIFCMQIKSKLESKEEGDHVSDIWQQEKNLTKAAKILGESKSQLHARESTAKTKIAECVNIMNNILELLFSKDIGPTENDIRDIMLILLRTIIQSSIQMDRDNPLVGNLVAIMLAIFRNMSENHYKMYVNHFNTRFDLQDFLNEILLVFKELVSKPVFPNDWLDMTMHQNTVILQSLRHFSRIIREHFQDPFELQVWSDFFHCSIAFLIQPALQLDQFTNNKRSMILDRYCDIRRGTAKEICNMWFNLGEHKMMFVPSMVGSFLEMSMIPETQLRRDTIPIFFDMMQCEYVSSKYLEGFGDTKRNTSHMKGNFHDFEKEMIEKLDILVEGGRGDHEYKDLFNEIMMNLCCKHIALRHEGTIFVMMATKLMERLLEYRFLINDESKENRMSCTVSLLQYYSEVNRKEMYIRYVNKLCDLHMEFENYPEAAFTLKLHSKLLLWNDTQLSPLLKSCRHPHCMTHRHLKEELYKEIIKFLDEGKMWESALEICKELAQQYEYETYDYIGLSQLHIQISQFYRKIISEMRHETEYYRVTFYGFGFPELLRNRTFIYRGKEYEQLPSFSARILNQHPRAELMQTLEKPGDEILNSEGQFIQINKVEPIVSERNQEIQSIAESKNIAQSIVKYYRTNNVDNFKFSRPFRDSSKNWQEGPTNDPDNVGSLWLERTIMKTEFPLPGILKWFPVESSETFTISPIECAIESMQNINKSLRDLVLDHQNDETLPMGPLTMKIQGIVDAAVNGGTAKYENAFIVDEYLKKNPEDVAFVDKLKDLIAEQIPILEVALCVHKQKVAHDLLPLHDRLETCFTKMQSHVEGKYGKRSTDLKADKDQLVVLRKPLISNSYITTDNRLSETSMGSSDSGISPRPMPSRQIASALSKVINFNSPTSFTRQTIVGTSAITKKKDKKATPQKRRNSQKMDREALSLPTANSQFYTAVSSTITSMLSPIAQSTAESKESLNTILSASPAPSTSTIASSTNTQLFELTEELTPKRPLRSEVEKEKRLSRTQSIIATATKTDNGSVSGESSNSRNSIITTDSQTSEEDSIPPPLPVKANRDSSDGFAVVEESLYSCVKKRGFEESNYQVIKSNFVTNSNYEIFEVKNPELTSRLSDSGKKTPPTPPPKPMRSSSRLSRGSLQSP